MSLSPKCLSPLQVPYLPHIPRGLPDRLVTFFFINPALPSSFEARVIWDTTAQHKSAVLCRSLLLLCSAIIHQLGRKFLDEDISTGKKKTQLISAAKHQFIDKSISSPVI